MRADYSKVVLRVFISVIALLACSHSVFGQAKCLTSDEVKKLIAQINAQQNASLNKELQGELINLAGESLKLNQKLIEENYNNQQLIAQLNETNEKNAARLCQIIKEFGWPSQNLVGKDGSAAALYLFKNSQSFEFHKELLPLIAAVTDKGEITKGDFAAIYDSLRLRAGLKQFFGTQATAVDGLLVLYPIENEAHVDERRNKFGLPPLASYLRRLERHYQMPLIKSPTIQGVSSTDPSATKVQDPKVNEALKIPTLETDQDEEVVRVETNLVNLNLSVYSRNLKTNVSALEKKNFKVFEDGREQEIAFFASTDVPFDLVLLLDLSGSIAKKQDLIRKSTKRFIEAARPSDRIAIVTFAREVKVISTLTQDRAKLLENIKKIEVKVISNLVQDRATLLENIKKIQDADGSYVWDALKFTLDKIVQPATAERRSAIVIMTDGVDNALPSLLSGRGSKTSFADLLETVRRSSTLVIPIYLDTEHEFRKEHWSKKAYGQARKTLALLAEESGGLYYTASKVEDLNGVYEQVLNDLGKVYSLGYMPTNDKRDGSWRAVKIQTPNHPDLTVRTRRGYYAN